MIREKESYKMQRGKAETLGKPQLRLIILLLDLLGPVFIPSIKLSLMKVLEHLALKMQETIKLFLQWLKIELNKNMILLGCII